MHARVCVVNAECTHAFVMCKSQIEDDRKGSRLIWHFTVVVLVQVLRIYMRVWQKSPVIMKILLILTFYICARFHVIICLTRRCYWIKCTSKVPMLSIRWCCPGRQGKQPSLSSCNIIFLTSPMESPCTHNWFFIKRLVLPTGQCPGQHDMTSNCLSPVELFTKSWPFILSSPTLDMRVNMLRRTGKDFKGMDL